MRCIFTLLLVFLLPIGGGFAKASDGLVTTTMLDQCIDQQSYLREVFNERFPHERCDPLSTCDPRLLKSANLLANKRCRSQAIGICIFNDNAVKCSAALSSRWEDLSAAISDNMNLRWSQVDRSRVSKFAIRRFDNPATYQMRTECPEFLKNAEQPILDEAQACRLVLGLMNINQMERLDSFLASQEAFQ